MPLYTNEAIAALIPRDDQKLDANYLLRALEQINFEEAGNRAAMGLTLNKEGVLSIRFPLPPLDEQRRIALILDKADRLRRERGRSLVVIDRLAQSVFLELFDDPIRNPNGYRSRPLIELVENDRGISYGIVQRGRDREDGVRVLRISDFESGVVVENSMKRAAPEIADRHARTSLRGGEIVVSIRGSVGRAALVPESLRGANVSREVAVVPTSNPSINRFYLTLLRTDAVQRRLGRDVKGAAQRGINLKDLRELPIIQPPLDLIDRFLRAMDSREGMLRSAQGSHRETDALFSSLQHRAFAGLL